MQQAGIRLMSDQCYIFASLVFLLLKLLSLYSGNKQSVSIDHWYCANITMLIGTAQSMGDDSD